MQYKIKVRLADDIEIKVADDKCEINMSFKSWPSSSIFLSLITKISLTNATTSFEKAHFCWRNP